MTKRDRMIQSQLIAEQRRKQFERSQRRYNYRNREG